MALHPNERNERLGIAVAKYKILRDGAIKIDSFRRPHYLESLILKGALWTINPNSKMQPTDPFRSK